MSGQSAKRQETTAMASPSFSAIVSLPSELLDTIFGFLNVRTLLTARLVCAQFRNVASSRLHSVELSVETLRSRPETHFNNFPNLGRVTVFDAKEGDLQMLAQSPIAAAITHLRAVEFLRPVPQHARAAAGPPMPPLPDLMSLTVRCSRGGPAFPFPQTLRKLALECPVSVQTWDLVPGLSNLTCLRIDASDVSHERLEAVTALTGLQRLDIDSSFFVAPVLAGLMLLTHLQFQGTWGGSEVADFTPLASLSGLHRLAHLGVKHIPYHSRPQVEFRAALDRQALACVATSTSVGAFETVCMTAFSQLTALRLDSVGYITNTSFLARFNLERLRDLTLSQGVKLDPGGVAALGRATGLTHLSLWTFTVGPAVRREEWKTGLSSLFRLRALFLGAEGPFAGQFSLRDFGPLTELTRLTLSGRGVTTKADVQVCLGLENLRVLSMSVPPHTPRMSDRSERFFALAKLRRLREFSVTGSVGIFGRNLMHDDQARVNGKRHQKGWSPLKLNISP